MLTEANGTVYMVMDYIEGESYEAQLKRIGTEPDEASLMAVIGPVLEGLEEVHGKGLLHRDIKPENILIKRNGQPVLIDFGAARESVGKTVTMTSIVTHGYSPIEQYQSKGKMGPWTDIYAVGAVMCRAITGEKPSLSTDRVMEDEFIWLSHRGLNGFSERFLNTADWALRVRTEERPQTVNDWKAGLGLASEHLPTTANVAQWGSQHQHPQKPRSAPANSSVPPNSGRGKTPTGKRMVVSVVAGAMGLIAAGFGIAQLMKGGAENPPVKPYVSTVDEPVAAATQTSAQAEPTPTPEPSPVAPAEPAPYAVSVPGKPGFVTSPHAPNAGFIDVRGLKRNTEVNDPYTDASFLVP
jgi:serine/threonine protein kinase